MSQTELQQLEKKREVLASQVVRLMIRIALIFAIPVLLGIGIHYLFDIRFRYVLPVAFIFSWVLVIRMYRKTDKQMRDLDRRIMEFKKQDN